MNRRIDYHQYSKVLTLIVSTYSFLVSYSDNHNGITGMGLGRILNRVCVGVQRLCVGVQWLQGLHMHNGPK